MANRGNPSRPDGRSYETTACRSRIHAANVGATFMRRTGATLSRPEGRSYETTACRSRIHAANGSGFKMRIHRPIPSSPSPLVP